MSEILVIELKSDLENVYKMSGDLLNLLDDKDFTNVSSETNEIMELIKYKLADICGIVQKDIFDCDYLMTKFKTTGEKQFPGQINWREENGRH